MLITKSGRIEKKEKKMTTTSTFFFLCPFPVVELTLSFISHYPIEYVQKKRKYVTVKCKSERNQDQTEQRHREKNEMYIAYMRFGKSGKIERNKNYKKNRTRVDLPRFDMQKNTHKERKSCKIVNVLFVRGSRYFLIYSSLLLLFHFLSLSNFLYPCLVQSDESKKCIATNEMNEE